MHIGLPFHPMNLTFVFLLPLFVCIILTGSEIKCESVTKHQCSTSSATVTAFSAQLPNVFNNSDLILLSTKEWRNIADSEVSLLCQEECCKEGKCNLATLKIIASNQSHTENISTCSLHQCMVIEGCPLQTVSVDPSDQDRVSITFVRGDTGLNDDDSANLNAATNATESGSPHETQDDSTNTSQELMTTSASDEMNLSTLDTVTVTTLAVEDIANFEKEDTTVGVPSTTATSTATTEVEDEFDFASIFSNMTAEEINEYVNAEETQDDSPLTPSTEEVSASAMNTSQDLFTTPPGDNKNGSMLDPATAETSTAATEVEDEFDFASIFSNMTDDEINQYVNAEDDSLLSPSSEEETSSMNTSQELLPTSPNDPSDDVNLSTLEPETVANLTVEEDVEKVDTTEAAATITIEEDEDKFTSASISANINTAEEIDEYSSRQSASSSQAIPSDHRPNERNSISDNSFVRDSSSSKELANPLLLSDENMMPKDKTILAALMVALVIGVSFIITLTVLFIRKCSGELMGRRGNHVHYTRIDQLMNAP